jgi:hypothetical protein
VTIACTCSCPCVGFEELLPPNYSFGLGTG